MGGVIIPSGIIHMFHRVIVSRKITHTDASVTSSVETVEVIRRSEIPVKGAGDHKPGVSVVSPVPIRQLQAYGPVKRYHIHPDLILLPYAVITVRLESPFFTFDPLQSFVEAVGFPVGEIPGADTIGDPDPHIPTPVEFFIIEIPVGSVYVLRFHRNGSEEYYHKCYPLFHCRNCLGFAY